MDRRERAPSSGSDATGKSDASGIQAAIMMDYIDPDDKGERYVIERVSNFWGGVADQYMVIDRNTNEPMRGRKQPDNRSKFLWRAPRDVAEAMCKGLNDAVKPRLIDPGTGPDAPEKSVNIYALAPRKRAVPSAAGFIACQECSRCHRAGACPSVS